MKKCAIKKNNHKIVDFVDWRYNKNGNRQDFTSRQDSWCEIMDNKYNNYILS